MEETINKIDYLRQNYIKTIKDVDDNIKTAFMNSLDSYGNPDSFNLEKILENLDNNEIIKSDINNIENNEILKSDNDNIKNNELEKPKKVKLIKKKIIKNNI